MAAPEPEPDHSSHNSHIPDSNEEVMASDHSHSHPQPQGTTENEHPPTQDPHDSHAFLSLPDSPLADDEDLPSYEESGSLTDGAIDSEHFSHSHSQHSLGIGLGLSDHYQYVSTIPTDLLQPSPLHPPSHERDTFEGSVDESERGTHRAISYPPPTHARDTGHVAPELPSHFVQTQQFSGSGVDVDVDIDTDTYPRGRDTAPHDYTSGSGPSNGYTQSHSHQQHGNNDNDERIAYPPGGTSFASKSQYNILTWHSAYISCQRYFISTGQYAEGVQALFDFINVRLPKDRDSSFSSPSTCAVRTQPSSSSPTQTSLNVPLLPYVRRLVATGFSSPEMLTSIFGPEARFGVLPLLETERQNLYRLFRHGTFDDVFRLYNVQGEELPFLQPPRLSSEEVRQAERADRAWEVVERSEERFRDG